MVNRARAPKQEKETQVLAIEHPSYGVPAFLYLIERTCTYTCASTNETIMQDGSGGKKQVKARVCRNVDGLDTHLFEKALEVRRAFLADPAYQGGGSAP